MFFAIMNAAGQFLPGGGRGGTWREFTNNEPPRLFRTRAAAQSALQWWLGGPGRRRWNTDEDSDDFYQSAESIATGLKRQSIATTIKVVEVELRLV